MITPLRPEHLYCVSDPLHGKFYHEQPASKLFILDREKKVLDESCFDKPEPCCLVRCYLCNAEAVDFADAGSVLPRIADALRNLMQKDNAFSRDHQVREVVAALMRDIVDARLFLRAEIKTAVPMKAFLTKYGLERAIVEYYKEKVGAIPAPQAARPAPAAEIEEEQVSAG